MIETVRKRRIIGATGTHTHTLNWLNPNDNNNNNNDNGDDKVVSCDFFFPDKVLHLPLYKFYVLSNYFIII